MSFFSCTVDKWHFVWNHEDDTEMDKYTLHTMMLRVLYAAGFIFGKEISNLSHIKCHLHLPSRNLLKEKNELKVSAQYWHHEPVNIEIKHKSNYPLYIKL